MYVCISIYIYIYTHTDIYVCVCVETCTCPAHAYPSMNLFANQGRRTDRPPAASLRPARCAAPSAIKRRRRTAVCGAEETALLWRKSSATFTMDFIWLVTAVAGREFMFRRQAHHRGYSRSFCLFCCHYNFSHFASCSRPCERGTWEALTSLIGSFGLSFSLFVACLTLP